MFILSLSFRKVCLALCILSISIVVRSQSSGSGSTVSAVPDSRVVIVGTATPSVSDPRNEGVDIVVVRVLHGSPALVGSTLYLPVIEKGRCGVSKSDRAITAIWFLNQTAQGKTVPTLHGSDCTPLRNDYEVLEAPPSGDWYYSPTASTADKIGYELAASLVAHEGNAPLILLKNPAAFEGLTKAAESYIYTRLAESAISTIQVIGRLGLVRMGNPAIIGEIEDAPSSFTSAPLPKEVGGKNTTTTLKYQNGETTISSFSSFTAESLSKIVTPDDATVEAIGLLLTPGRNEPGIRRAAARALRNLHTAKAVRYLSPLLYDDDPQLRVEAVGGLACFANGVPVLDITQPDGGFDLNRPGPWKTDETMGHFAMGSSTIQSRETYYLSYWRTWWNAHGASI